MWVIYALGGGWGHLTRACALARAHPARIISNSPHAEMVGGEFDVLRVETREDALREVRAADAECLIVDTFPRGLGGELAGELSSLPGLKVLIHRDLNPRYVESAGLHDFVASHYDLVLVAGEGEGEAFGDLPLAQTTAPWLIRSSSEIAVSAEQFVYVCAAGKPEEANWYAAVSTGLREAGVTVRDDRVWPAMEIYASAALVVGGGGYNTVNECLALGVPLVARAWPRKYDRQNLRLERAAQRGIVSSVSTVDEAVRAAIELWNEPVLRAATLPAYRNGVWDAVRLIQERLVRDVYLPS